LESVTEEEDTKKRRADNKRGKYEVSALAERKVLRLGEKYMTRKRKIRGPHILEELEINRLWCVRGAKGGGGSVLKKVGGTGKIPRCRKKCRQEGHISFSLLKK